MKIRSLIVSGIVALMAASGMMLTGCGGASCEGVCEDAKACPNGNKDLDCAKSCSDAESLNAAAGCSSQYDDLVSCQGDSDDVCATGNCNAEAAAYVACTLDFCSKNPMAAECTSGS